MLALLGSEWARPYLTQPDTFYIALCFKNGGDCTCVRHTALLLFRCRITKFESDPVRFSTPIVYVVVVVEIVCLWSLYFYV